MWIYVGSIGRDSEKPEKLTMPFDTESQYTVD